jgi:hypothetical protein
MMCDICNHEKDTLNIHHLQILFSESDKKDYWNICPNCESAFRVVEEYIQGYYPL